MAIGGSFQHTHKNARRRRGVSQSLVLIAVFILVAAALAQQAAPARSDSRQAAKATSPYLEAESLLRQGPIAEAKQKIEEQLKLDPSSVDGYNLLGIVYSSEKDYDHALESFEHALKIESRFHPTHNNLGNLYVAQDKFDLAEKEFGKDPAP